MSRRDPFDLLAIDGNILDWQKGINRKLASVARRNVSADSLDQIAQDLGNIDHRAVDDSGLLRMVMSAIDLYDELGVHAYLAALAADGVTPTFWVDADTGLLTAGGGSVVIGDDGIVIQADNTAPYLIFKDESGTQVASIFQDGAGNLQFDLADDTKSLTVNDGNVISGHGTGKDSGFYLHENFTAKSKLWWDASAKNIVLENITNDGSGFLVLTGNAPNTQRYTVYNASAGYGIHRFFLNGAHQFREQASLGANPDANYLSLWAKNDHTLHVTDSSGNDLEVGTGGGGVDNLDGGVASSTYGAVTAIDGGSA